MMTTLKIESVQA
jgi:hypothetical protein